MLREGQCAYCKQVIMVDCKDGTPDEEANEIATMSCGCDEAKEAKKIKESEEKAKRNIEKLFGEYDTGEILMAAVHSVQIGAIDSVKVNIGNGISAEMKAKDGKIQVIKTTRIKDSMVN